MSSTTIRRSKRTVKQVSYAALTGDSSSVEQEDTYDHPITVSDSSEANTSPVVPPRSKRQRVSKVAKSSKTSKSEDLASSLNIFPSCEMHHPTSRHDPQRLLPYLPALLSWFEEKREVRGMPWRKIYDPTLTKQQRGQRAYEVLVSEIMLQQTQVATVIPYYNRWLDKFPTLETLANADLAAVHALWKGLGYYRRAGFLLAAAKKVKTNYEGHIPEDAKIMQKDVPGMGRYTAGAVASIAYGIKAPVLDGNVQRLLSRALAVHANSKSKQTLDMLWGAATILVEAPASTEDSPSTDPGARPGNINQALIELGSTVCRPTLPLCEECPLKSGCAAYELTQPAAAVGSPSADIEELCRTCEPPPTTNNSVTRFPMKLDKKKSRQETSVVCAIQWTSTQGEEWWLMTKRPATGLLAGLWEFPTLDLASVSTRSQNATSEVSGSENEKISTPPISSVPSLVLPQLLTPGFVGAKLNTSHIGSVFHKFSHIDKTYEVVCAALPTLEQHGDHPPDLIAIPNLDDKLKIKDLKPKRKRADSRRDGYVLPVQTKWVIREELMNQNVSVGMQKVWELVLKNGAN